MSTEPRGHYAEGSGWLKLEADGTRRAGHISYVTGELQWYPNESAEPLR